MTRRDDSQEVRRRTISAGIKLFIEKGYHKTTVSDICRLADVSNGSFFNVFRTKNGLLMELVVNMFNGQFDAADSLLPADSEPHMLYVFESQNAPILFKGLNSLLLMFIVYLFLQVAHTFSMPKLTHYVAKITNILVRSTLRSSFFSSLAPKKKTEKR